MNISLDGLDDDVIDDAASELRHEFYLLLESTVKDPWVGCGEDVKELYRKLTLAVVRGLRRHES